MKRKISYLQEELKLDNLLKHINDVKDDESKSHLCRYFCIRISGYLENVVKGLINDYCDGKCPVPIQSFVTDNCKTITNLRRSKIEDILQKFSADWKERFCEEMSKKQNENLSSSLDSIISNRNNIAHGKNDSLSLKNVSDYYSDLKEVIKILKAIIKK